MNRLLIAALAVAASASAEVRILTTALEPASRELPYHATVRAMVTNPCESGDVALSLASGELPKGLEIAHDGIAGVPQETGTFTFRLRAANACTSDTREFELLVGTRPMLYASESEVVLKTSAPTEHVLVSANRPGVAYVADTRDAPWLTIRPETGHTPSAESALAADRLQLSANPAGLKPGTYSGTVLLSTWGGANVVRIRVKLIVPPA